MSNNFFQFKQFLIRQERAAMKVTTDACLFGGWVAEELIHIPTTSFPEGAFRTGSKFKILEIGTGTGVLALMAAQKSPAIIDAIEIDKATAEQAKENMKTSPWHDRLNLIQADARYFEFQDKYDFIISNPPFYENEIKSEKEGRNLAHHSSELSLKEVLLVIRNNLSSNGKFFLLLPYKRNKEIARLLKDESLAVQKIVFVRQSVNHDFFRIMLSGGFPGEQLTETIIEEISIRDESQEYTPGFRELLKDYYLYL